MNKVIIAVIMYRSVHPKPFGLPTHLVINRDGWGRRDRGARQLLSVWKDSPEGRWSGWSRSFQLSPSKKEQASAIGQS